MTENETIAEVLCNLWGDDPNDEEAWKRALAESVNFRITSDGDLVQREE